MEQDDRALESLVEFISGNILPVNMAGSLEYRVQGRNVYFLLIFQ